MNKSRSSPALLKKWQSVEIISEETITTPELPKPKITKKDIHSDSELIIRRSSYNRRTLTRTATMSGLALKADVTEDMDDAELNKALFAFDRVHMVTSDGILVISSATNFMIERRITLNQAKLREVKNRKRTALLLTESKTGLVFILKFRCRSERQKWFRVLKRQSGRPRPIGPVEFTPNKRRQIYFIDGPEQLKRETEQIQAQWDKALCPETVDGESKSSKIQDKISTIAQSLLSCVICK